ncbi:hypothetical protein HDU98_008199 [Podochytrium sp. JEL0797]|nr:hypothetical protein HDU98_008199 [Podochytrium sp. JEL0797]
MDTFLPYLHDVVEHEVRVFAVNSRKEEKIGRVEGGVIELEDLSAQFEKDFPHTWRLCDVLCMRDEGSERPPVKYPLRALSLISIVAFTQNRLLNYLQTLLSISLKGDDASQVSIDTYAKLGLSLGYTAAKTRIADLIQTAADKIPTTCDPRRMAILQDNVEDYCRKWESTMEQSNVLLSRTNTSRIEYVHFDPSLPTTPAIPLAELKPKDILPSARIISDYHERQHCVIWNQLVKMLPIFDDIPLKKPSCGNKRPPLPNDIIPTGLLDLKQGELAGMTRILDNLSSTYAIPNTGSSEATALGYGSNQPVQILYVGDLGLGNMLSGCQAARFREPLSTGVTKFTVYYFVLGEFHVGVCLDDTLLYVFDFDGNEERGTVGYFGRKRNTNFTLVDSKNLSVYEKERILMDTWAQYLRFLGNSLAEERRDESDLETLAGKEELLGKVVAEVVKMMDERQNAVEIASVVTTKGKAKKGSWNALLKVVFTECVDTGDGHGVVDMHRLVLPVLMDGKEQASRYVNAILNEQVQLQSCLTQEMAWHSIVGRFVNPSGRTRGYIAADQRQERSNRDLKQCKGIKKTEEFQTAFARSLLGQLVFKAKHSLATGVGISLKNGFHPPPKYAPELEVFYKDLETIGMLSDAEVAAFSDF